MFSFFVLTLLLSIIGFFVGLISPAPFSKLFKRDLSRKQVANGFGWLMAASLILTSFTAQVTTPEVQNPSTPPTITQEVTNAVAEIVMPAPPSPTVDAAVTQQEKEKEEPEPTPIPTPVPTPAPAPNNAPNGTYTNVYGNEVPSPYEAPSRPEGASALCEDGTYSFSQSRRGTCSHHGGVAEWY